MDKYILGISGSPRRDGNTDIVVQHALDEIQQQTGIETKFIRVADVNIKPCIGCRGCMREMQCVINDDDFNSIFDEVMNAEGLILGAPVYWNSPPGVMKNFIDRAHTFYACPEKFPSGKIVGIISVATDSGFKSHEDIMQSWIRYYGGQIVGMARIYAREKGEVLSKPVELEKVNSLADALCQQI